MTADVDRLAIRDMHTSDVATIADLKGAGAAMESSPSNSPEQWRAHLRAVVDNDDSVTLVATRDGHVRGYLLSVVVPAPPEPPGPEAGTEPVAYVTDFAVATPREWWVAGTALLDRARQRLRDMGAGRLLVPVDMPNPAKRAFLWRSGLTLEVERYESPLM